MSYRKLLHCTSTKQSYVDKFISEVPKKSKFVIYFCKKKSRRCLQDFVSNVSKQLLQKRTFNKTFMCSLAIRVLIKKATLQLAVKQTDLRLHEVWPNSSSSSLLCIIRSLTPILFYYSLCPPRQKFRLLSLGLIIPFSIIYENFRKLSLQAYIYVIPKIGHNNPRNALCHQF